MIGNTDSIPGFRARLAALIGDEDPFGWAKRAGIPSSTFDRIWNLGTTPKARHLIRISEVGGVSLDWLLTGRAEPPAAAPDGLVPIPWLRPEADSHAPAGHLALDRAWLRRVGFAEAETAAAAVAAGDSMEPAIRDGDLLLVDTGVSGFRDDAIYLLALVGGFRIRRAQRLIGGAVAVTADNPAYAGETLSAEAAAAVRCLGRVRWSGRAC